MVSKVVEICYISQISQIVHKICLVSFVECVCFFLTFTATDKNENKQDNGLLYNTTLEI